MYECCAIESTSTSRQQEYCISHHTVVPGKHLNWVQALPMGGRTGLAIYKRVPQAKLDQGPKATIRCIICNRHWRLGMRLCLSCWEPLSLRAIHDHVSQLETKAD